MAKLCFIHINRASRGQTKWSNQYTRENCYRERAWINTTLYEVIITVHLCFLVFAYQHSCLAALVRFKNPALYLVHSIRSKYDSYHFYDAHNAYVFSLNPNPNKFSKIVRTSIFFLSYLWVYFSEHIKPLTLSSCREHSLLILDPTELKQPVSRISTQEEPRHRGKPNLVLGNNLAGNTEREEKNYLAGNNIQGGRELRTKGV